MKVNKYIGLFLLTTTLNANLANYPINASSKNNSEFISIGEEKLYSYDNNFGNEYLLGPGDSLLITFVGIPDLSGEFGIGPDGIINLPQIESINVSFLTLNELKTILTNKYKDILIAPNINIQLSKVRPIRVYVKGEIKKPGFYNLNFGYENNTINSLETQNFSYSLAESISSMPFQNSSIYPTLYDALKESRGITSYSDLTKITVIRNNSLSKGGGKISTDLNFLSLFLEGNQSQNIRLFDGDTIVVPKSDISIKEQLLEVYKSNMNPETISVFVSGKVKGPGIITLPRGSGLNQAIAMTGGKELLSGRVEFVRYERDGEIDRRVFSYKQNSSLDSSKNPILEDGDIINVKDSLFTSSTTVLNKILQPVTPILFIQELID